MRVRIAFEIGHTVSLRTKVTPEGYTHNWELFVRGIDGAHIERYVDKVVYTLHDSFPRPVQTSRSPPYSITESGYASFNPQVDIHFRCGSRDEPKFFSLLYDLDISKSSVEKKLHIISSPSSEFRHRLLEGGAIVLTSDGHPNEEATTKMRNQLITNNAVGKKHKSKPDEPKPTSKFESLFGSPIQKISNPKHSPDTKVTNSNSKSASTAAASTTTVASNSAPSGLANSKSSSSSSLKSSKDRSSADRKSSKEKKDKTKSTNSSSSGAGSGVVTSKDSSNRSSQYNLPTAASNSAKESTSSTTSKKSKPDDKHDRHDEKRKDKDKSHSKDRERSKEKSSKRPTSPAAATSSASAKQRTVSPKSLSESPVPRANSSSGSSRPDSKYEEKASSSGGKKSKKEKRDKSKERERSSATDGSSSKKTDAKDGSGGGAKDANSTSTGTSNSKHHVSQTKHKDTADRQSTRSAEKVNGAKKEADSSDSFAPKDSQRDKSSNKYRSYEVKPPSPPPVDSTTASSKAPTQSPVDAGKSKSGKHDKDAADRKKHKKKDKNKDRRRDRDKSTKPKDISDESSLSTSSTSHKRSSGNLPTPPTQSSQRASNASGSAVFTAAAQPSAQPVANVKAEKSDSGSESDDVYPDRIPKVEKNDGAFVADVPSLESPKKHSGSTKASGKRGRDEKVTQVKEEKKSKKRKIADKQATPTKVEECSSSSTKRKLQSPMKAEDPPAKLYRKDADEKPTKAAIKIENETSKAYAGASPLVQKTSPDSTRPVPRRNESLKAPKMSPLSSSSSNESSSESLASLSSPACDEKPQSSAPSTHDKGYLAQLQSLHHKIMTIEDDDELQEVVEMIAASGRYEISSRTFDFDLGALDRTTVKRLQERLG